MRKQYVNRRMRGSRRNNNSSPTCVHSSFSFYGRRRSHGFIHFHIKDHVQDGVHTTSGEGAHQQQPPFMVLSNDDSYHEHASSPSQRGPRRVRPNRQNDSDAAAISDEASRLLPWSDPTLLSAPTFQLLLLLHGATKRA